MTFALSTGEQAAPAAERELKSGAGDALDLRLGVHGGVEGAAPATGKVLDAAGQAEVSAPAQLAHHHQIGAADQLRAERSTLDEGIEGSGGTQPRIDVELPAKAHQPVLVDGIAGCVHVGAGVLVTEFVAAQVFIVARIPHRAHQHRIDDLRPRDCLVAAKSAVSLPRGAVQQIFLDLDPQSGRIRGGQEDFEARVHDFGANALAPECEHGEPVTLGRH